MPTFRRPGQFPKEVYPEQAGRLIEELRRFIGHDRLMRQTAKYHSEGRIANGVRMARYREDQPLIEAFDVYEKSTRRRQRPLRSVNDEIADLANVAAQCHVVAPTLTDAIRKHHLEKLIDLNGQLKPLLLEWKTVSHFVRAYDADIAWLPIDHSGPEFIARIGEIECEIECKRQSHMIIDLLGEAEADDLAGRIIRHLVQAGLRGKFLVQAPDDFDREALTQSGAWDAALALIPSAGDFDIALPGGLRLTGQALLSNGHAVDVNDWQSQMRQDRQPDARLYAQARAVSHTAVDPIELHMIGPSRTAQELIEYLWERKFNKAASQCSGERGAVLVFEWEGIDNPAVFMESGGLQDLLARTFREHRHVAAISMRCDSTPTRMAGLINYATDAYLAKSNVTSFPQVRDLVRLDT